MEEGSILNEDYLRYSVVDMSLNGGTGDVVSGVKNIFVDSNMSEKMAVVRGAGCYYWLITHRNDSAAFYVYKIDESGLHGPFIQSSLYTEEYVGTIDGGWGTIKIAPNQSMLAMQTNFQTYIQIARFDNSTGTIYGNILIDSLSTAYMRNGLAFSPDNTKLYSCNSSWLHQFDISLYPDIDAIESSKEIVHNNPQEYVSLRNGPDGKIYFTQSGTWMIGVIHNPNASGLASNAESDYISIPDGASWYVEAGGSTVHSPALGNDVVLNNSKDTLAINISEIEVCPDEDSNLVLEAPTGYTNYNWSDGSTGTSVNTNMSGTYWVVSTRMCEVRVDTFKITHSDLAIEIIADSMMCSGSAVRLSLSRTDADSYLWQNGDTDTFLEIHKGGVYFVTATKNECSISDSITIQEIDATGYITTGDTTICKGDIIEIRAVSLPYTASFLWSTGSTLPYINIFEAGEYKVTINNQCGSFEDKISVATIDCNCNIVIPSAFSPNNDGLNDRFKVLIDCEQWQTFNLNIINRYGENIFTAHDPEDSWDGTYNGKPCDVGAYFFNIEVKSFNKSVSKKGDVTLVR
ncbi:MAG: gliding motility-associated C-terminal domain-containing protein [Taibaiella sp.]|nr:gliding motility-associated C-terminal domain-containing protein [Taibaiella sp.]